VFTGLFVQFIGQTKLEPIVREGKIAMIPGEAVPTTMHTLGHVYLVDAHVFGGNSGSPMLIDLGGQRDGGPQHEEFAGWSCGGRKELYFSAYPIAARSNAGILRLRLRMTGL
jgi:hypothetical protein